MDVRSAQSEDGSALGVSQVNERFAFDASRAAAAQLVVIGHAIGLYKVLPYLQPPGFAYLQNIGVVLFFFLSGVLITNSILNNTRRDPGFDFRHYLFDRATRIYSGLLPALGFILVVDMVLLQLMPAYRYHENMNVLTWIGNLMFLQDYPVWRAAGIAITLSPIDVSSFGSGRPLWTLAIEWWTYMCAGALLVRWPAGAWRAIVVLLLLLALPVVFLHYVQGRGSGLVLIWFLGAIAAGAYRSSLFRQIHPIGYLTAMSLTALWAALGIDDMANGLKGYNFHTLVMLSIALLCALRFFGSLRTPVPGIIGSAAKWMAGYAYTLYLIHFTILYAMHGLLGGDGSLAMACAAVFAANLMSLLLAYYSEMRLSSLKHWLWPQRYSLVTTLQS